VGDESRGTVTVLEASSRQPIGTIEVGGRGPFSIEVDPLAARAYVTGGPDGTMAVLDTRNLVVVEEVIVPGAYSVFTNPVVDVDTASIYLIVSRRGVGVMARK
jgi:DNA-binding beta-propeller fold protein YncE